MSSGYHINADDGLISIHGTADATITEAMDVGRQLLTDPEFDPRLPHLIDFRGLHLEVAGKEAAEFATFALNHYRPAVSASVAIVVDDSLDRHALAALYHLICRMSPAELFDNYEQALKWLMRLEFANTANQQDQIH